MRLCRRRAARVAASGSRASSICCTPCSQLGARRSGQSRWELGRQLRIYRSRSLFPLLDACVRSSRLIPWSAHSIALTRPYDAMQKTPKTIRTLPIANTRSGPRISRMPKLLDALITANPIATMAAAIGIIRWWNLRPLKVKTSRGDPLERSFFRSCEEKHAYSAENCVPTLGTFLGHNIRPRWLVLPSWANLEALRPVYGALVSRLLAPVLRLNRKWLKHRQFEAYIPWL